MYADILGLSLHTAALLHKQVVITSASHTQQTSLLQICYVCCMSVTELSQINRVFTGLLYICHCTVRKLAMFAPGSN